MLINANIIRAAIALLVITWGSFMPEPVFAQARFALRAVNQHYVSVAADGRLFAESPSIGTAETFEIVDANGGFLLSGDRVFLRSQRTGIFVGVNRNIPFLPMMATSPWMREWETLTILKKRSPPGTRILPGDSIHLRDFFGDFVSSVINWWENDRIRPAVLSGTRNALEWETFTLVAVPLVDYTSAQIGKGFMLATWNRNRIPLDVLDDINRLADQGATLVRFPLYLSKSHNPSIDYWIAYADAAARECAKRNVTMVIDVHHPGTLTSDQPENFMYDVGQFVRNWERIARHFRGRRGLWYELLNEPKSTTVLTLRSDIDHFRKRTVTWYEIALRAARAIRAIDRNTPIVFGAPGDRTIGATDPGFRMLAGISNQILTVHVWDFARMQSPELFSLASEYRYNTPGSIPTYTRAELRNRLRKVKAVADRFGVAVFIGEFGILQREVVVGRSWNIPVDHPDTFEFMSDFLKLSQGFGFHVTLHAYKESDAWNYEFVNGDPNDPKTGTVKPVWDVVLNWFGR